MILDLYENGSNRIHTIGAPQTTAVSEQVSSESEEDDELAEMMMAHSIDENPNEALIESLAPSCLSLEEQQSCFIDTDDSTGFFSPVLPTVANFPTTRQTEHIDNEVTALITSSLAPQKTRPKSTPHFTVYPVRPTTPMGDTITTTMQAATVTDFPRTPLIMCSSLAVIIAIAAVVFFVFKCRQNPPNSEHYTMAMKSQSGYTAIAPELSPPMNHDRSNDSCTQPLLAKPHINGNGYEPLKGAVIANGNGATATMMRNGNGNGVAKKKDFKEWYV